jgi:hypothetical protein
VLFDDFTGERTGGNSAANSGAIHMSVVARVAHHFEGIIVLVGRGSCKQSTRVLQPTFWPLVGLTRGSSRHLRFGAWSATSLTVLDSYVDPNDTLKDPISNPNESISDER